MVSQFSNESLISKLSLQFKKKKKEKKVNKQAKLYSTTMYTAPQVKERAGAMMKGKGMKQTPVKQESFLAQRLEL